MVLLASALWLTTIVVVLSTSRLAENWVRVSRAACAAALVTIIAAVGAYVVDPGAEPVPPVALGVLLGTVALGASLFGRHAALIERLGSPVANHPHDSGR